jgi:hypothetical protein
MTVNSVRGNQRRPSGRPACFPGHCHIAGSNRFPPNRVPWMPTARFACDVPAHLAVNFPESRCAKTLLQEKDLVAILGHNPIRMSRAALSGLGAAGTLAERPARNDAGVASAGPSQNPQLKQAFLFLYHFEAPLLKSALLRSLAGSLSRYAKSALRGVVEGDIAVKTRRRDF